MNNQQIQLLWAVIDRPQIQCPPLKLQSINMCDMLAQSVPKQDMSNIVRHGVVIRHEWLLSMCRMRIRYRRRNIIRFQCVYMTVQGMQQQLQSSVLRQLHLPP
jgi:hypothetical protein